MLDFPYRNLINEKYVERHRSHSFLILLSVAKMK